MVMLLCRSEDLSKASVYSGVDDAWDGAMSLRLPKMVKKAKVARTVIVILETAHGMIPAIGAGMMRSG